MFGLGMGEIVIILVIALIFLGPKKLPELAQGLGKGIREFQNAMKGVHEAASKHETQSVLSVKEVKDAKEELKAEVKFENKAEVKIEPNLAAENIAKTNPISSQSIPRS